MHIFRLSIFFVIFCISLVGCSQVSVDKKSLQEKTLFDRIGGLPILNAMVNDSLKELSTNPKTKRSFEGVKLKKLQESIVSQLCYLTGGGCVYDGETMKNSHADAKITASEFELFVQIHRVVFDKYIGTREKNELLKILAPMRRDIVTSSGSSVTSTNSNVSVPVETASQATHETKKEAQTQ